MRLALPAAFLVMVPFAARGEGLDLTRARIVDWSLDVHGGVRGACALLSPTLDPAELSELRQRGNGVRLSSQDREHCVVVAIGPQGAGSTWTVMQATVDRFQHIIDLEIVIRPPERAAPVPAEKGAPEEAAPAGDFVIGPREAKKPKYQALQPLFPKESKPITGAVEGNTAIFLPTGRLEPAGWWLRVSIKVREGSRTTELSPITDKFTVHDNRTRDEKEKGENTPEIGLQRPNSKSVTEGMQAP